jgi:hypothetical protein
VVMNSDRMRVNRKTIRDDKISGDRDVPVEQKGSCLLHCYTAHWCSANSILTFMLLNLSFPLDVACYLKKVRGECVLSVRPSVCPHVSYRVLTSP